MDHEALRHRMVQSQLRARGIHDERVLQAMETVPRHAFVPPSQCTHAYDDAPLPIGCEQTISQPYMVARMTELLGLSRSSRVLEIGTGSGYQTAILAELADSVWSIERLPELATRAEGLLGELGYDRVQIVLGDGTLGHAPAAPYSAIVVTAAAPKVPETLRSQLASGGRMVIPVTRGQSQELLLIGRSDDGYCETSVLRCVFVPLIGVEGYQR